AREERRLRCGGHHGMTIIDRCEQRMIAACGVLMLGLQGCRRRVLVVGGGELLGVGLGDDSPLATVEAHVGHRGVVDHRLVVDVCNVHAANVDDGGIVHEDAAVPVAALVANPGVPETI